MIASIFQISGKAIANLLRVPESQSTEIRVDWKLKPLACAYAVWWLLSLVAFTTIVSLRAEHKPVPSLVTASLEDKLAYYHEYKSEFDLVLLGDSLTYTGLHPEFIDPELGTHSVNMAIFAHWFATQYPFIQDLIPEIPKGTGVLWSVHLYDFDDGLSVQHAYAVGLQNALRYWSWGGHNPGLAENVLYYNPLTSFFVRRGELRSRVIARGDIPVSVPRLISPAFAQSDFPAAPGFARLETQELPDGTVLKTRLTEYYGRLPYVAGVATTADKGQINSVVLTLKGGGYYRIELMPEYFREKQREIAKTGWHLDDQDAEKYVPQPLATVSLKMFVAGLAAFRQAGIPVTINVMEEAPWVFPNEIVRRKEARLMDDSLRRVASQYGDNYVHVDYSSIVDADYFDYNHFNSSGIAKYTPLLIRQLRKLPAFARPHDR